MGLPLPKGILNIYAPFLVNFASTPARFLLFVDPLLPYGFGMRIFKAYGAAKPIEENRESFESYGNESSSHQVITDVHDDVSEILLSPDSRKSIESMWLKVKNSTETSDWQTNLNSIQEMSPEDIISPLVFRTESITEDTMFQNRNLNDDDGDDDGGLEMKISKKSEEKKEEFLEFMKK